MNNLYLYIAVIDTDKKGNYFIFRIIKDKVIKYSQHPNTHDIYVEETSSGKKHLIRDFEKLELNNVVGYPPYLYIISNDLKFKKEVLNIFQKYLDIRNDKYYKIGVKIAENACKKVLDELNNENNNFLRLN